MAASGTKSVFFGNMVPVGCSDCGQHELDSVRSGIFLKKRT